MTEIMIKNLHITEKGMTSIKKRIKEKEVKARIRNNQLMKIVISIG